MFASRVVARAAAARVRGAATVAILDTAHPGDVSQLSAWLASHPRAAPRCVLGKTEGNGCVNDFTRGYASHVVHEALDRRHRRSLSASFSLFTAQNLRAPESRRRLKDF